MSAAGSRLDALYRARPRSRFLRASLIGFGALAVASWFSGLIDVRGLLAPRRLHNLERFISKDIVPAPLRGRAGEWQWSELGAWAGEIFAAHGLEATLATLSISVVAIVLAGAMSWFLAPLAARNVATKIPFDPGAGDTSIPWRVLRLLTRAAMIVSRAVPEYIVAFLLLAVLGPDNAWPAVIALALHNGGILGRLGAETIENLDAAPMSSMRAIGAPRRAIIATAVFPLALGRYLLYFFYRFETCVREATVLGMLGVVSLGYWIQDARAKMYYDEMLFLVALGAVIVLASDLLSAVARRYVRGAK